MPDPVKHIERPGHKLGLFGAIAIIMGNMIGSGVFLLPASLAPFGWNAVLGWVATISGTMVLAYVFAQLMAARGASADPLRIVENAFGPLPSYLVAFAYWVSIWTAVVSIAIAAISYLSLFFPIISETPMGPSLSAIALVWLITLVNLRGTKSAGNFQIATVLLKLLPLIGVIALGAWAITSGTATVRPFVAAEISLTPLSSAASLTLFALLGFECASLAANKVKDPHINVPRATLWGTAITGLIYLLVCSAIALMLPEEIAANSPAPFSAFAARYFSEGAGTFVAIFAIISCVGAVNGWIFMQGELPSDMAKRSHLPAWFAISDGKGTPRNALLASSWVASFCLLANSSRSMQGLYEFILLLSTSAALWLYLTCMLAALRLNIARPFAMVGAAYALWTLWGAGIEASAWSLALMISGLPLYFWARRARALTD